MSKKRPSMNKRAALLFALFSVLFFLLTYRFVNLQITGEVNGKQLVAYAEEKYSKNRTIPAVRGSIYDQNGKVLATDSISYKLIAILSPTVTPKNAEKPRHVADPVDTARRLANFIPMDENEIYSRLVRGIEKGLFQVELGEAGRNISYDLKTKIDEEAIPGITFIQETKRSYPNGVFASHLLGFANYQKVGDTEKLVGQIGLESLLDSYLEGHDGKVNYQSDRWGLTLPTAETNVTPAKHGNDVYLTLDKKIQTFLEDAMTDVQTNYEPEAMMAVVADAKTGAILAMSQRPTFDPNTREGINDNWQNIIVETAFEPGSTMKIFTLASAIEEGVFNPNATFQSGRYNVPGGPIRDYNHVGWGEITYLEGFLRSSNVAVANLLDLIGHDRFREYLDAFKFGIPTGTGLSNEASGTIQYTYPIDRVTTSFGQGSSVTVLQLIQAMTAITNEGKMMKPYVIDKIVDQNGEIVVENGPKEIGRPISSATAKEVMTILEAVVSDQVGSGKRFAIDGYEVVGKTGTAQIYDRVNGGYLSGRNEYIFSFLGAAPYDDPKLIMYVMVQQPKLNDEIYEHGSVPVSKIFNTVMRNSLSYLNVEPDQAIERSESVKVPDLKGKLVSEATTQLTNKNLQPIIIGNGTKVQKLFPESDSILLENEKILIVTDGDYSMPNIQNWSMNEVIKLVHGLGLNFEFEGTGYVVEQSINPGQKISSKQTLKVKFEPPFEIYEKLVNGTDESEEEIEEE